MSASIDSLKTKFSQLLLAISNSLNTKLDSDSAAVSAGRITTPFNLTINGDAAGNQLLDGSQDVALSLVLAASGVTAGVYGGVTQIPKFTVDSKGRVTDVVLIDIQASTAIPVNEYVTIANDAVQQYDLQTILGASFADYDLKTAEISLRVKDTNATSPTFDAYVNAEGVAVYGVLSERYVVISNQSGSSLDFYVKVLVHPVTA